MSAATQAQSPRRQAQQDGDTVGRPVPQLEAAEKLSGTAQYIADLYRPGMLHGAILRSPYAHARIVSIDTGSNAHSIWNIHGRLQQFESHRFR